MEDSENLEMKVVIRWALASCYHILNAKVNKVLNDAFGITHASK